MNSNLLHPKVQTYLRENILRDFRTISLEKSPFENISSAELAQQIKGLQVAQSKFPFLYKTENIIYPLSLNLEQASSLPTAHYKANLIQGKTLIDLTAGMGIDAYAFAQNFEEVTALERNSELVEISQHNYKALNQNNLNYINTEFEAYFEQNPDLKWDVIYLDPARRKDAQKKFLLEDLEPNILEWMDEFLLRAKKVVIKLSPLFDLKMAIQNIPQIQAIHLIAVKNEMKELLLICEKKSNSNPSIHAINLESEQNEFKFTFADEENTEAQLSDVQNYIYEPNAAVMKSGAFQSIALRFGLNKLDKNTHLYTSEELVKDFPGRIYQVIEEVKNIKKSIQNKAFHVVSRNHPLTVPQIRQKYKIKESEDMSLIFTQSISGKIVLICKRILN